MLAQKEEIQSLHLKVSSQDDTISKLNDKIGVLSTAIENLKNQQDNQEQYSRIYCLRINGIAKYQNETPGTCIEIVVEVCNNLNVNITKEDIDRAHRVGKEKSVLL